MTRRGRMGQIDRQASFKITDQNKHIYVSENALIELMQLCEPLEDEQIDELLE